MRAITYSMMYLLLLTAAASGQQQAVETAAGEDPFAAETATDSEAPPAVTPTIDATAVVAATADSKPEVKLPNRWLLICCGLPGDEEHRDRLTQACKQLVTASGPVLGVTPDRLRLLAGDEEMQDALSDQAEQVGITTKESVAAAMEELAETIPNEDACWVVLIGHAHLYDGSSQFNVLDQDFNQTDFAQWAKPLACREQVFWITTPVSGFWVKPLSGESRVVISATEPDLEYTGTEMPYALADLLTGAEEQQPIDDIDEDGSLSLLDLYLAVNLEIHARFESIERLQTEHAQLDDNADGRGTEVQFPYLPVEVEEEEGEDAEDEDEPADDEEPSDDDESSDDESSDDEQEETETEPPAAKKPPPITNQNLDGFRSRQIPIRSPAETEV